MGLLTVLVSEGWFTFISKMPLSQMVQTKSLVSCWDHSLSYRNQHMPFNATTCGCLKRCSNILIAFDKPPGTSSNPATARLACILWPQTKCMWNVVKSTTSWKRAFNLRYSHRPSKKLTTSKRERLDRVSIESMLVVTLYTILLVALAGKHGSPDS